MIPVAMPVLTADLNTSEIAAFGAGGIGLGLAGSEAVGGAGPGSEGLCWLPVDSGCSEGGFESAPCG